MSDKTGIIGKRVGPTVQDEQHLMRCGACGEMFDMRYLDQVFHHEEPGHKPIAGNDR